VPNALEDYIETITFNKDTLQNDLYIRNSYPSEYLNERLLIGIHNPDTTI